MHVFKLTIGAILFCSFTALFLVFIYPRYYILDGSRSGVDIAAEIVEKKRSPKECNNILDFDPFPSPSAQEQSNLCVYVYAELMKDPFACDLLMPSSYTLDCVGAARDSNEHCSMSDGHVYWENGKEPYINCREDDPKRSQKGNQCCLITRVRFVKSENDCSPLLNFPALHDECLKNLAFKNHEPLVCDSITDANLKAACIVNAKAIKKAPDICMGCKELVESIEELK